MQIIDILENDNEISYKLIEENIFLKLDFTAYIILSLTMVIWGITDPLGKWMVRITIGPTIPPLMIALLRDFFGTVGFILILYYRERSIHFSFVKKHFKILLLMGILSVTIYQLGYFYGLDNTAASDAALILGFAPIWVLLLTFFTFHEPVTSKKLIGTIMSLIGVLIIIGFSPNVNEPNRLLGDGLIILSMISYASYGVIIQYLLKDYEGEREKLKPSTLTIITWVTIFGFICLLPFTIILTPSYITNINLYFEIPERIWFGIIYLVVFATILANLMFVKGVSLIKASRTAIFANLIPLIAIITSALFLNEKIDPIVNTLSFFLVLGGVFLVNRVETKHSDKTEVFKPLITIE